MKRILPVFLILAALVASTAAAVRSGKAAVDWISISSTCEPGAPLQTAIRLVVDGGWHTYWLNPGEAGMKPSFLWRLPQGWSIGEPGHPVPRRFSTGGLAGFGYEGTVIFPVTVTPPADFKGTVKLAGTVSWLTCNDEGCVPGEAGITLDLTAGTPVPGADAPLIREARRNIPQPQQDGLRLAVMEKPTGLVLVIEARSPTPLDLERYDVFPATPQVVDPAAEIRFTRHGAEWRAEVAKSEYAESPVRQITLVLSGKGGEAPLELAWKSP